MEKVMGWKEGFQMLIGWNVGPSKNGCCRRNQTWSLSGHFVGGGHTGSDGVSADQTGRNGRTGRTGAGWWWGSRDAGFEDSVLNESLILHLKFVKRRTDQHHSLLSLLDLVVRTLLPWCKLAQLCMHGFYEL